MSDAAERLDETESSTWVRVRYPETDRMNVAYHAHYAVWFELGRTEFMRDLGWSYETLEQREGIHMPVLELGARYHSPARYDDLLAVRTRLTAVSGARVRFEYRIVRAEEEELLATGFTVHGAVGRQGRPTRLPAGLRRELQTRESA